MTFKCGGKGVAAGGKANLAERVSTLEEHGIVPGLGTLLVGEDPGSMKYVAGKHADCAEVGIRSIRRDLPADASFDDIAAAVRDLNEDPACTGYIVQLPLPRGVDENAIIGLIDLDDAENVIASKDLIAVAEKAGTYVGDKEKNTIDYVASYNADQTAGSRMVNALAFFNAATAKDEPEAADYTISNVDADGNIVPMYTSITLDHAYSIADVVAYYHIAGIGSNRNLETHIFQTFADDGLTDTVEWVAMDDAALSVFVPYYPMLTTKTYAGYQVSTDEAVFTEEEPTDADVYYPTTKSKRNENGERVQVEGFCALPADWADSCYWTMDALSNLYEAGDLNAEEKAKIDAELADLQAQAYEVFDNMKAAVAAADTDEAKAAATAASEEMAAKVHAACVALVNEVK
mgnify:CR=1 FL=1